MHRTFFPLLLLFFTLLPIRLTPACAADIFLRSFSPTEDYTGTERYYNVVATEKIQSAKLIFVEDWKGARLYEDMPMLIEGGVFATTQSELILPAEGAYRFCFGLSKIDREISSELGDTTEDRQTFFFTTAVRSRVPRGALRNIKLSRPPYYVNHSFEVEAFFSSEPLSAEITLRTGGVLSPAEIVYNNGGLSVVGYLTPMVLGKHTVVLSFKDPVNGVVYQEEIPLYADVYDRYGDISGDGGGGGCDSLAAGILLACFLCASALTRRGSNR